MAIYRNVRLSIWTDNKVIDDFTPEDKYFYLYLLTNPQTNLCGCYEISYKSMSEDTGYNKDTCLRLLKRFDEVHNVIKFNESTKEILILNWYKYNWSSSAKTITGVMSAAKYIKCEKFRNYLAKDEGLFFDIDTIRIFISGFAASHFMILEGLSGTGKSSLPRYFAKFSNSNVLFVPVQATWRDKTNILGYFNDFSKIYSETDFLVRLYESNYNPDRLHFFVLDEMNISRVEYYFADFLSTLEFPEEEWKLRVMQLPYNFVPPAKLENGNVSILNNAYFVGTANKDDSTFSIADKVYDRAITIDFDNRNEPFEVSVETGRINLSKTKLHELYNQALSNKDLAMTKDDHKKFQIVTNYIYEEFDLTFGNRILTQIDTLVPVFMACGGKKEDALDFLLSRKVIVKLEGRFEEYVKPALKRLINLIEKTYGPDVFKRSEREINKLIRKL